MARGGGRRTPDEEDGAHEGVPKRRRIRAIMGAASTRGFWRVPRHVKALAWWGHVHVDMREAAIDVPVVEISARAMMGGITITVPPGVRVEMRGSVLMGGAHNSVRSAGTDDDMPLVRVQACGLWGGVVVKVGATSGGRHGRADGHGPDHGPDRGSGPGRNRRVKDAAWEAFDTAMDAVAESVRHPDRAGRRPRTPPTPPTPPSPSVNGQDPSPSRSQIPPGTLTMLVSDIAGSTRLAERLGDQRWMDVLQAHNAIVRGRVAERGGTEVKAQGDGFLFVFPSARSAVLSAIDIQRALADHGTANPDAAVEVRVGLHTGEVVATDDDVFGQNVVVASRIADVARAGEIAVSGVTRDLTASASDLGYDDGVEVELKGISRPCRVHRVQWSQAPGAHVRG